MPIPLTINGDVYYSHKKPNGEAILSPHPTTDWCLCCQGSKPKQSTLTRYGGVNKSTNTPTKTKYLDLEAESESDEILFKLLKEALFFSPGIITISVNQESVTLQTKKLNNGCMSYEMMHIEN